MTPTSHSDLRFRGHYCSPLHVRRPAGMATFRSVLATVCVSLALCVISLLLHGCGGDDQTPQSDSAPAFVSPITLSLAWNPVPDPSVTGYVIHYGTNSPNSPGSCNYEQAVSVTSPSPEAVLVNLHPETRYYISVSSFNGAESACSAEVSTVTAPMPTQQETTTSTT